MDYLIPSVHSNSHTTKLFSMPDKDWVRPNTYSSMPKIQGCSPTLCSTYLFETAAVHTKTICDLEHGPALIAESPVLRVQQNKEGDKMGVAFVQINEKLPTNGVC